MVTHWICQSSYGIIQDEQILVLVLPESKDQSVQNVTQIWHQLCACLFLQGCKCTEKKQDDEGQCWIYTQSCGPGIPQAGCGSEYNMGTKCIIVSQWAGIFITSTLEGNKDCSVAHLQAASCTFLLLSRMRFRSSVMSGLRYESGGWETTQCA